MNKKTIAIIFGGHSSEYSVSLESTYSLLQHINKDKYHLYLIGITLMVLLNKSFRILGGKTIS